MFVSIINHNSVNDLLQCQVYATCSELDATCEWSREGAVADVYYDKVWGRGGLRVDDQRRRQRD